MQDVEEPEEDAHLDDEIHRYELNQNAMQDVEEPEEDAHLELNGEEDAIAVVEADDSSIDHEGSFNDDDDLSYDEEESVKNCV
jgi:hypothetical protein